MVTMKVDGGLKICKQGGLKTCEICVGFEDLVSMAMDLTLPIKNWILAKFEEWSLPVSMKFEEWSLPLSLLIWFVFQS